MMRLDWEGRFWVARPLMDKSAPHREQQNQQQSQYRDYVPGLPPKRSSNSHLSLGPALLSSPLILAAYFNVCEVDCLV